LDPIEPPKFDVMAWRLNITLDMSEI